VTRGVAGRLFRALAARRGSIVTPLAPAWQRELKLLRETRSKTQLLVSDPAALHLLACARAVRTLPGAFAEAGVFKGGSARLICGEKGDAPLHLFDIFEMLQEGPVGGAEEVRTHFGAVHGRLHDVRRLLASYPNVHFHPGLFPDTTAVLEHLTFSFVHLDLDLPGPTQAALDYFHPRLVPGGILLADDYSDPELRVCFESWFAGRPDTLVELPWSQLMVVRQGSSARLRR
jgi:hypothetical protein